MNLPCVVYNATGPIQVRWYHSQNGNPADAEELNITAGGRYTVEESEQSPSNSRYESCTEGDQLYQSALEFNYSEGDIGSYWCRIVIGGDILLELSEAWTVLSINGPAMCGTASQTDPKCAGQIVTTPALPSTILLDQSTPTSVVGTTSELSVSVTTVTHSPVETPSALTTSAPSVPSSNYSSAPPSPECGGTPCSVYGLAAGVEALTLILLVGATVSVLVCIKLYLQGAKKIASKFMFSPYALRISVSAWHSTAIFGNRVVLLSLLYLCYFLASFPGSFQVMERWPGPGNEAYHFTIYQNHGNSKTNETVFKTQLLHAY